MYFMFVLEMNMYYSIALNAQWLKFSDVNDKSKKISVMCDQIFCCCGLWRWPLDRDNTKLHMDDSKAPCSVASGITLTKLHLIQMHIWAPFLNTLLTQTL